MVWTGQSLFLWHTNRNIAPNERLEESQKQRVGYFIFHNNIWWLVNEKMDDFYSIENGSHTLIEIGEKIKVEDGVQLLFSKKDGGRLAVVQMIG